MSSKTVHVFVPECESLEGLMWTVRESEMLCDIKALLSEYYIATFTADGMSLNISFNNGQSFRLTVNETTQKTA